VDALKSAAAAASLQVRGRRRIRGGDGAKVHAGKLDTEADRRRVPEAYRDRVERLLEEIGGARR
jgi:hypothetical protein